MTLVNLATQTMLGKILTTFFISMLPIVELRAGLPYGIALGLPYPAALVAAVLGNMVPVPFIILFIRKIFAFLKKHIKPLGSLVDKLEARAQDKAELVHKYELLGLMILVAIPLPGTGAWTGTLAASLLDMGFKESVLACMGGVILAGIIMGTLSLLGVSAFGVIV